MGKKNLEMTSIRLAFSIGNFFFFGVWWSKDLTPFAPLTPLVPFVLPLPLAPASPLTSAFLHLDVNSVTVEEGRKDSAPPMGFWKQSRVCQWSEFPSSKSVWQIIDNFSIPYSPARCVRVRDTKKRWKIASRADFGQIWNGHTQKKWELFSCVSTLDPILQLSVVPIKDGGERRVLDGGFTKKVHRSLLLEWWITFPNGSSENDDGREPLRAF